MEGLSFIIFFLFFISFGIPTIFFLIALFRWKTNKNLAKVFLIIGIVWLIIGGGSCLSLLNGA
jgi:hypothetical protein